MEACSQKMPTNNRWAKEALISKVVTDAEVTSSLKDLDETNLVACQTYYKLFKNKDAVPKNKVQETIDRIKVSLAHLLFVGIFCEHAAMALSHFLRAARSAEYNRAARKTINYRSINVF